MPDVEINPFCPVCGKGIDLTNPPRPNLKPGHAAVCIGCAQVLLFNTDMSCRVPSAREMRRLQASPFWPLVEDVMAAVHRLAGRYRYFRAQDCTSAKT